MFRKNLGWLWLVAVFVPSMAWAQYCPPTVIVKTWEACAGPGKTNCTIHHTSEYVPSGSCPPPSSPPVSVPPSAVPPQSPPPATQVVKTPEEIEREQHVKFCKEFPVTITGAVDQCINQAMGYHGYFTNTQCSKAASVEWKLGFFVKDAVDAGYSKTFTPNATCRQESLDARDFYINSCRLSGNAYRAALAKNCADVN